MTDLAPYWSAVRSVAIAATSSAATFGIMTVAQSSDMLSGVDDIIAGGKEIAIGVSMLTPVVMGAWGVLTHRPKAVLTAAAAIPGPEKLEAFRDIPEPAMLKVVHALPDVAKIVVKPTASPDVKELVDDKGYPKVVAAT